jgi:hypothetical protein
MFATYSVRDMRYILFLAIWVLAWPALAAEGDDMVKAGREALARMDVPLAMTYFD